MAEGRSERLALPLLEAGQAQKELFHNEALTLLDMLVQAGAESAGGNATPVAPEPGQCWIVGTSPTGAWAGHSSALAGWTAGGWRFVAPVSGMTIWVADRGHAMLFDGGGWIDSPLRPDGLYFDGMKVVGPALSAIADPAGGTTVDGQARAAIALILTALRNHGLIASA